MSISSLSHRVVALYAIADYDICDFVDMVGEPETTNEILSLLLETLEAPPTEKTDVELNKIAAGIVRREIAKRSRA